MHYIHLGHVGLVSNCHWRQILSYVVGWPKSQPEGEKLVSQNPPTLIAAPIARDTALFHAR